jgi:hypothetical protein
MSAHIRLFLCLAAATWLSGCGPGGPPAQRASQASTEADSQAIRFMPLMLMHLDWMARLTPAQMRPMMSTHRQMAERVIWMMEPRGTMGPGSPWTALRDSIQGDLSAMPGLSGADLAARSQAHIDRMRRMMVLGMATMPGGGWAAMHGGCGMLDSVSHMSAEQRQGLWTMHARMSSVMMSAMIANMQERDVVPGPEWAALRDSLSRDMAEMPKLQGDSLRSRMQSHAERMHRLMAWQAQAMGMPGGQMGVGCW